MGRRNTGLSKKWDVTTVVHRFFITEEDVKIRLSENLKFTVFSRPLLERNCMQ